MNAAGALGIVATAVLAAGLGSGDVGLVRDANRRFDRAQLARDIATIETMLAADFTWLTFAGAVMNRPQTVQHLRSGDSSYTKYDSVDVQVQVLGDVALVTGVLVREGRNSRRDLTGRFRYTRVFVEEEGNWRLRLWQVTAIADSGRAAPQ